MLIKRLSKLERLAFPEKREPVTVCLNFGDLGKGEITMSKVEWLRTKRDMVESGKWEETPEGDLKQVCREQVRGRAEEMLENEADLCEDQAD